MFNGEYIFPCNGLCVLASVGDSTTIEKSILHSDNIASVLHPFNTTEVPLCVQIYKFSWNKGLYVYLFYSLKLLLSFYC